MLFLSISIFYQQGRAGKWGEGKYVRAMQRGEVHADDGFDRGCVGIVVDDIGPLVLRTV